MTRSERDPIVVSAAREDEVPALAALAAELVRQHHAVDPRRFLMVDDAERGYARWLHREMARPGAVVVAARSAERVVGYGYATLEGRDWAALLDAHGAIHDVMVDPAVRRQGVGRAIVGRLCADLGELGAPRIVLHTMVQNEAAIALFDSLGFRQTMIEMTRGG